MHKLRTNDINIIAQLHSIPELQAVAAVEAAKTKEVIVTWETTEAWSEWSGQTAPGLKCLYKRLQKFKNLDTSACLENKDYTRTNMGEDGEVHDWTPAAPQSTLQEAGSSRGLADCSQVPKVRKLKQWRVAAVTQISRLTVQSWGFIEPVVYTESKPKSSSDTWICTQKSGIEWNTEGLRWSNCL